MPLTDNRSKLTGKFGDVRFVDTKLRTCEKRSNSGTQKECTQQTISKQKSAVRIFSKEITRFILIFVGYSLYNKAKQYQHPNPVGTTETGGVEQRERSKKCTSKSDECGKGVMPFFTNYIRYEFAFVFRFSQRFDQSLSALNEKQE